MSSLILVTGATDGIGKQTAADLLRLGHSVIVHGRSAERAQKAAAEVRAASQAPAERVFTAAFDLSSLAAVRAGAQALLAAHPRLDVAVLNAGLFSNERRLSADKLELTFAVNHLAHFLLVRELMPAFGRSAAERKKPARIVVVASMAHTRSALDLTQLQSERSYTGYGAYALSKACNILFATELAARSDPHTLVANSLHPGVVSTKLLRQGFRLESGPDSLEDGATTSVFLATSADIEGVTGKFFMNTIESQPSKHTQDPKIARKLWDVSEGLVGASR